MPWILYDPDDDTYLAQELYEATGEDEDLWQNDEKHATEFETEQEALQAIEAIDVEDLLLQIVPLWREPRRVEQGAKRWEDMTFAERMQQVEEDAECAAAERVHRLMMKSSRSRRPLTPKDVAHFETLGTVTGRISSSQPARQYLTRPRPIDPLYYPYMGSAPDMAQSASFRERLKESLKDVTVLVPTVPTLDQNRDDEIDALSIAFADRMPAVDYASIELRTLLMLKERDPNGQQEDLHIYADAVLRSYGGGQARPELPDGEGVPGGSGADRGRGG